MCVVLCVLCYVLGVLDWTWTGPGLEQCVCCVICFMLCVRCTGPGLDLDWSNVCGVLYVLC